MSHILQDEARALETVIRRLAQRYPHCSILDVESAVRAAYERFDGRPIREFVPVLVERFACDQLANGS
jgi:hypothetical protein